MSTESCIPTFANIEIALACIQGTYINPNNVLQVMKLF